MYLHTCKKATSPQSGDRFLKYTSLIIANETEVVIKKTPNKQKPWTRWLYR